MWFHQWFHLTHTCPRAGPNGGDGDASPAAISIRIIPTTFELELLAILFNAKLVLLNAHCIAEARPRSLKAIHASSIIIMG